MNKKEQKDFAKSKVVPEWKYKLLLARIDEQDKKILELNADVDRLVFIIFRLIKLYTNEHA